MNRKIVHYMPDFYFDYYEIEDHLLSIPMMRVKKVYITYLLKRLEQVYNYYVEGMSDNPYLGSLYLKTALHPNNIKYPNKKGVKKYRIYQELISLNRQVDSWIDFQKEHELTDEELFLSAYLQEEENLETTPDHKTDLALEFSCWRDYRRPELIKALKILFRSYADIKDEKIHFTFTSKGEVGSHFNKQAIAYFVSKLGPYVRISMKSFVAQYITIDGIEPSYDKLTKHVNACSKKFKEDIDAMFIIENTFTQ